MASPEFSRQKQQIIAIIFILVILFLAYKFLLPYYAYAQFKIDVQKICNWDQENYMIPPPPDVLSGQVLKAAHKRNIPVSREHIWIRVKDPEVKISVRYKLPIDLIFKKIQWELKFEVKTEERY
jgi:hypothetical protein